MRKGSISRKDLEKKFTKEFLEEQLKSKYLREIAKEYNTSWKTVNKYIKLHNVRNPTKAEKTAKQYFGKKFGILTVGKYMSTYNNKDAVVEVHCDCGKTFETRLFNLQSRNTRSCGCLFRGHFSEGYEGVSLAYINAIASSAKKKGLELDIDAKYIWDIYITQDKKCCISGLPVELHLYDPKLKYAKRTASVDRIDSSKGYIRDNVQIVHKVVNIMKNTMSMEEFEYWIYNINKTLIPRKSIVDKVTNEQKGLNFIYFRTNKSKEKSINKL